MIAQYLPPSFSADTPPAAAVGSPYSYQFQASGTEPITFSATGLPVWAQLDPTSGILSGTPPAPGTFDFTVTARNGIAPDATADVSLLAQYPPTFTADTPPAAAVGSPYSYQFQASGGEPITFSATGLPAWAQLDPSSGILSGTPTAAGTFDFTVTASNEVAPDATADVSLTAQYLPPTFTADMPPAAAVGAPYSYQFQASGTEPITFSATGLPAWAQLDPSTGILSGTPGAPGTFAITVTASNGIAPDATSDVSLLAEYVPPTFTADTPPAATVGSSYSYQFEASGTEPITFSAAGLPAWAQLDPTSGILSGTPTAAGTLDFAVTASNGVAPDATADVSLLAEYVPPTFTADSPPVGVDNSPYSYQFQATGTGPQAITYSATGLPGWAQFNASTGVLSGTPTADGTYDFRVTASDGVAPNPTVNVSLIVAGEAEATFSIAAGTSFTVPNGNYAGGTTFNVGAGATVTIDSGTFTGGAIFNLGTGALVSIIGSPSFSGTLTGGGAGTVQVGDGRLYVGSGGLTLDFSGSMFQWASGQMDLGDGDLTNLGTMTITAPVDFYNDGILYNFGTIIQTGTGNLQLGTDGTFPSTLVNGAGADYLLEGDGGLSEISDSGSAAGQTSLEQRRHHPQNGRHGHVDLSVSGLDHQHRHDRSRLGHARALRDAGHQPARRQHADRRHLERAGRRVPAVPQRHGHHEQRRQPHLERRRGHDRRHRRPGFQQRHASSSRTGPISPRPAVSPIAAA